MDFVISEEQIQEVFDQITCETTQKVVGIQLTLGDAVRESDLCTVHITFKRGFSFGLSLCADMAVMTRLTRSFLKKEEVTPQEVEEAAKEYFNVLCGRISRALFKATNIASRFGVPSFHQGDFSPQGYKEKFALSYSSDQNETIHLVYHISAPEAVNEETVD